VKPEDIAAYIGAAAWVPQIVTWVYQALSKPVVNIVPEQFAHVSFSTWGPGLSFRMAFFVENRDLIVDGIEVLVRHQGGDTRRFRWTGVNESISEITDAAGNKQTVSRDQYPIAIKISTQAMLERYVRFNDASYNDDTKLQWEAFVKQLAFLQQKRSTSLVAEMINSREFSDLIQKRQSLLCWREGKYDLTIHLTSPQKRFNTKNLKFSFELSEIDVENLRKNVALVEEDARNYVAWISQEPKPVLDPTPWCWVAVQLLR
jgi:hypothetical protein